MDGFDRMNAVPEQVFIGLLAAKRRDVGRNTGILDFSQPEVCN
jgi:hypothetical protein